MNNSPGLALEVNEQGNHSSRDRQDEVCRLRNGGRGTRLHQGIAHHTATQGGEQREGGETHQVELAVAGDGATDDAVEQHSGEVEEAVEVGDQRIDIAHFCSRLSVPCGYSSQAFASNSIERSDSSVDVEFNETISSSASACLAKSSR